MAVKCFNLFLLLDVPDYYGAVIATGKHSISVYFDAVNPAFVSLVHHGVASFYFKAANNWITASHENVFVCYLHAFDGLLGSNETFNNFIRLEIHTSYHLVPGGCEEHVVNAADSGAGDRVSKLEDGDALASFVVPLANCAVVRCAYYVICLSGYNGIDSVGMPYQRCCQLCFLRRWFRC